VRLLRRTDAQGRPGRLSAPPLAIGEHHRTGWVPTGQGDAASLEQPLRDLATWLKKAAP